jgi:hypothetical protein
MWTNAGKVTRGYTNFYNMKEVIYRISQMTHMEKRSLTNDIKLMNKVHKFVGDYYKTMLVEESKIGYVESVTPERYYTEYNNMREIIHRCYTLTHIDKLTLVNESIILNKVHDLSTQYYRFLDHEERQIYMKKFYV